MRINLTGVVVSATLAVAMSCLLPPSFAKDVESAPFAYPKTESGKTSDVYHGISVPDPYRWLEDTNSEKTHDWVLQENAVTRSYLDQIAARKPIATRLKELWNYPRCGLPTKEGRLLFYSKNNGLQNQDVLYVQDRKGVAKVLLDPNLMSKDGTVNLAGYDITIGGDKITYGLSSSGSDWEDWYFKDVATGKTLPDHLKWLKNAHAVWAPDGQSVYYTRYDEPTSGDKFRDVNYFQKVYHHVLGTDQSADTLVYERKDQKEWNFDPMVTDDGHYLMLVVTHGTSPKNGVFIQDLTTPDGKFVELFQPGTAMMNPLGNDGDAFYFMTDEGAPTAKIVSVHLKIEDGQPLAMVKSDLIAPSTDTLENASFINEKFLCQYLHNACSSVSIFDKDGKLEKQLDLPGIGTVHGFSGRQGSQETYFTYTGFTTPTMVYHLNLSDNTQDVFFRPKVKFNSDDYTTEEIFCPSKDGTKVPVFVSYKKGLTKNRDNPTYLYGYGGFKISMLPTFSPSNLLWMERGGIYAVAILRGGGEFGEQWHEAGMKLKKQNVFDDFIAAANGLIDNQYTKPQKLAIGGGSNGGLLVGACITQQPNLFGGAVAQVGVMDMLRFNQFTVGWEWEQEYGSPKNEDEFKALLAYSPLHNIKTGVCYPATLITTADHDDRVVPGHSFKFAATLQAMQGCAKPALIRIDTKAGHGHGKSTAKLIEEATDKWAFLTKALNANEASTATQ